MVVMSLDFDPLYDRTRQRVWNLCRRLSATYGDAENAFQEIYLLIFRYLAGFRGESSVDTWCFRIALNYLLRKRKAQTFSSERRLREEPAHKTRREVDVEALTESLGALDPEAQQLVTLVYLCGIAQEDAAHRLSIPIGTVHSRLSRARDKMKEELKRHGY